MLQEECERIMLMQCFVHKELCAGASQMCLDREYVTASANFLRVFLRKKRFGMEGIMRNKKLIAALLAMAVVFSGCGADAKDEYRPDSGSTGESMSGSGSKGDGSSAAADGIESKPAEDAEMNYMEAEPMEMPEEAGGMFDSWAAVMEADSAYTGEPLIEPGIDSGEAESVIEPVPGLLTAGEWCDNTNWGFFVNLVKTGRFDFQVFGMKPYERVVVHAISAGTAVRNAKTELYDAAGTLLAEAVTDHDGTAYLYYNLYDTAAGEPAYVTVSVNGVITRAELSEGSETVNESVNLPAPVITDVPEFIDDPIVIDDPAVPEVPDIVDEPEITDDMAGAGAEPEKDWDGGESWQAGEQGQGNDQGREVAVVLRSCELTVEIADDTAPAKKLDVMFVFDTTGSMADELLYLQKEFEDIAARVADQSTRFSVNFYRDIDDAYVVRANDFTSDINEVAALLNAEYADGGGDYEEAVDLALLNAVLEHSWDTDSIKLMFLILDAPPHNTAEVAANLERAVSAASAMGIRIIPIASSGVDTATEALLRNMAMVTGGTYTFLTNDSGIGGEHLEPTIGSYTVEALNDLIVRLIQQYY